MYPFALGRGGGWRRRRAARGVASPGTVTRAYWRPTLNISGPIFTVSLSIVRNKHTHREVSLGILLTRIFVRRSALGPRCCGFLKIRSFERKRDKLLCIQSCCLFLKIRSPSLSGVSHPARSLRAARSRAASLATRFRTRGCLQTIQGNTLQTALPALCVFITAVPLTKLFAALVLFIIAIPNARRRGPRHS